MLQNDKKELLKAAVEITKAYASSGPNHESHVVECLETTYHKLVALAEDIESPSK